MSFLIDKRTKIIKVGGVIVLIITSYGSGLFIDVWKWSGQYLLHSPTKPINFRKSIAMEGIDL